MYRPKVADHRHGLLVTLMMPQFRADAGHFVRFLSATNEPPFNPCNSTLTNQPAQRLQNFTPHGIPMSGAEVAARLDNRVYNAHQQNGLRGIPAEVGQNRLIPAGWIDHCDGQKSRLRTLQRLSSSEVRGRFANKHHVADSSDVVPQDPGDDVFSAIGPWSCSRFVVLSARW